eukprot:gnl/TRDRNA2_/TRDRNA2_176852_c0_seq4.p1 gnl/TRDRNA2_/TRDRNA2_176852_c0~~gnl/TRDRNA2_/TRDRNA2_176852_c0_seq4.p1  ORF type:complete len:327 (-),score=47.94 gnl/TRDRNA2_/TRDRNA2_176852_c0_seq4:622-1602(-)
MSFAVPWQGGARASVISPLAASQGSYTSARQTYMEPRFVSYPGGRSSFAQSPSVVAHPGVCGQQQKVPVLGEKFMQHHEHIADKDVKRDENGGDVDGEVFLTGFGQFPGVTVNASWEAVRALAQQSPTIRVGGRTYRLRTPAGPVDVSYRAVDEAAAAGHFGAVPAPQANRGSKKPPLRLVIHAGVAMPGPVRLEAKARNQGYRSPDVRREVKAGGACVPPCDANGVRAAPCRGTCLDLSRVCASIRKSKCGVNVEVSDDAGLYLCEYIYYKSLRLAEVNADSPAVLFVHVPPIGQPYSLPQLVEALRAVVQASLEQASPHGVDEN